MDKNKLKEFAIESRNDLMQRMKTKINSFYVEERFNTTRNGDLFVLTNENHVLKLNKDDYEKRNLLIKRKQEIGLDQVIEESAYTWFNRIIALRYMEINDYLPLTKDNQSLGIRVLSSKDNTPDPEIMKFSNLTNSLLDINFDINVYQLLTKDYEKYQYVLLLICKKLGKIIPQVFDGVTDYIDILIPDNLLNDTGFISKLIKNVPEDNFKSVEVIGWLYQYYNQSEKDRVISAKKAYKKNEIPYATQLFTPDWIVKYMVENSLGRYYLEHNGYNESLASNWKYLIKDNLDYNNSKLDPKDITFIDPCCGSGHILVYAFDVLYQMYLSSGYNKSEIPELILKNNLYGLDIDDRAGQLSVLSVLLKAREYDKNIFNKDIVKDLNVLSIQESSGLSDLAQFVDLSEISKTLYSSLNETFKDAKEIGSLLKVEDIDYSELIKDINNNHTIFKSELMIKVLPLIKEAKILSKKYDCVVTNPPYMNSSLMSLRLKEYIASNFKNVKNDLFSAFIINNINMCKDGNYLGFMTPYVWMFISSYEDLRNYIIDSMSISSLIQMEYSALEEAIVPICSFVLKKSDNDNKGIFFRLTEYTGGMEVQNKKYLENINTKKDVYFKSSDDFKKIPGSVIGYWISDKLISSFKNTNIGDYSLPRQGLITGDNNRFLRFWFEISLDKFGYMDKSKKWIPMNKGGEFKKWYGNQEYVVNWENDGYEIKNYKSDDGKLLSRPQNLDYSFKKSLSWSLITSGEFSVRYYPESFMFNVAGISCFPDDNSRKYILGLLNSKISSVITKVLNPTLNMNAGDVAKIPVIYDEKFLKNINEFVSKNIEIAKQDWDFDETSWNFIKHPILMSSIKTSSIKDSLDNYNNIINNNFSELKYNEEELNKLFIDIYGLQEELTPEESNKDITIRKPDKLRDIKSFMSYAVGCMFGRYSLDIDGLAYAGGEFDWDKYKTFKPDQDNIIPITDETYFDDDITNRFKKFVKVTYGENTFNENMNFIAEALGKNNNETDEDTIRRYFLNDFYKDHVKTYQKRPIYWLFDSGKKNGFKCLIYMHRYNENTIPKIRLDYLHRIQDAYSKELNECNYRINNIETNDAMTLKTLNRRVKDLSEKLKETQEYDEKIAHLANQRINIDLDDGVVNNYAKFQDILAKIK